MSLNAYKKRAIWGSLTVGSLLVGAVGYREGYEDFTGRGRTLDPITVMFSKDKRNKRKEENRGHSAAKENHCWWPKIFLGHCITVVLALPSTGTVIYLSVFGSGTLL